jgi:hypothetical protein
LAKTPGLRIAFSMANWFSIIEIERRSGDFRLPNRKSVAAHLPFLRPAGIPGTGAVNHDS